jgi:hypothetical protein
MLGGNSFIGRTTLKIFRHRYDRCGDPGLLLQAYRPERYQARPQNTGEETTMRGIILRDRDMNEEKKRERITVAGVERFRRIVVRNNVDHKRR